MPDVVLGCASALWTRALPTLGVERDAQPSDASTSLPAPDLFDDGVGIGGPGEGLGVFVGLREEAVDGGLEIDDALEDAALEPLLGQLGEEAFDRVEPGGRGRGEVEVEPRMPFEPGANLGMLVRRIVVDDQVQVPPGRGLAVDLVEKADELLMPVAAMHWPMTRPSSTSSAANSVVVPWRL